ncbi:autotransporter domain-containing protein [Nitratireductor rhodophyticola]|uniref:autotransporter outer membrane beta-barrel domain-containing protein n=1 Tax=Nitratireductor rhodophyticola TaxID=2854036 RepID=UPI002AC95482|nr:autotransporter domain-containing protein [Nitratireductor rhodophyticola]WPZ15084.1 autotransporter domain-containing protein [Nitratireductor rhodophyticola]
MTRHVDTTLPRKRHRVALLSGTALMGAALIGFLPATAHAQTYSIEGGASETVDGGGGGTQPSPWSLPDALVVGNSGTGELTVQNGGVVNVMATGDDITIGGGDDGTVTVTGASSALNVGDRLNVGTFGKGELNIADSGAVDAGDVSVALTDGSTGTMNVAGGSLHSGGYLYVGVGNNSNASVTMSGGATVVNDGQARLGFYTDSTAVVDVAGANTRWTSNDALYVGSQGIGELHVADQAVVSAAGAVYLGNYLGARGEVTVDGAGSRLEGDTVLSVGNEGDGYLAVSNGGSVTVNNIRLAYGASSFGSLVIGGDSLGTAVAAGTVDTDIIQFRDGAGTIIFNHTDTGYVFDADISNGPGSSVIRHEAGQTLYTGFGSADVTEVSGGELLVNGTLNGTTTVTGGILGGTGTLEGVTIASGGTLAPGNSIGTLNVLNMTFDTGSTYTVELDDAGFVPGTNNDLIAASEEVTINGGTVHVTPENGAADGSSYAPGTYTIITAVDGITGTFDTLTDDYAFLDFTLDYGTFGQVDLISALAGGGAGTCPTDLTFNQGNTCGGVLSLGSGNSVYDAVIMLSNAEAPVALDLLSGEVHASAKTALLEDSRFAREAALDRLRVALGGVRAKAGPASEEAPQGTAIWLQGSGAWSRWGGDGNAATLDRNIGGLFMGADAEVAGDIRVGLMGGFSRSGLSVSDRMSSGTVDSYTLGAYAGGNWDAFSLKGGVAYSWNHLDTSRSATFTGFSDSLSASYNARTFQAYAEAAYSIEHGSARFEPFANLAFANLATDGYTERGGAAALTSASQSSNAVYTTLGIRAETPIALGETTVTLSGDLGWRRAFGDTPTSTHSFASGGDAFTVAGVPHARNALMLGAGFNVGVADNASIGLSYNGQLGSGLADHAAKAILNVTF